MIIVVRSGSSLKIALIVYLIISSLLLDLVARQKNANIHTQFTSKMYQSYLIESIILKDVKSKIENNTLNSAIFYIDYGIIEYKVSNNIDSYEIEVNIDSTIIDTTILIEIDNESLFVLEYYYK